MVINIAKKKNKDEGFLFPFLFHRVPSLRHAMPCHATAPLALH